MKDPVVMAHVNMWAVLKSLEPLCALDETAKTLASPKKPMSIGFHVQGGPMATLHFDEGSCRMKQALIRDKQCDTLYLLPSAQTKDKTAITPEQMVKLTEDLSEEFDYILLDCPAGIEQGFKNAIAGADSAIVVTTPEVSAIRDADRIIGLLQANEMPKIQLIINRLRMDMVKRGEMMSVEDVTEILAVDLLGAIPDDEAVVVATNQGEPLCGKNCPSGQALENICRRISGEAVPLMDFQTKTGVIKRLSQIFRKS